MIVDNIDIVKKHVATVAAVDFKLLQGYVEAAEDWIKNELTGDDLFLFIEKHKADDYHQELINKVQRVIALNAYERALPFLDLVQTNNGFAVTSTEGLAPASKERVAALRDGTAAELDNAVEALLLFLEQTPEYHDEWKGVPNYILLSDTFLPNYTLFKRYTPYSAVVDNVYPKSRRQYLQLAGKLREVMADKIQNVLGSEFMDELLEQLRDDDLPAENAKLLEPLRFALGLYSIGLEQQGDKFMVKVTDILKNTPADYPTWSESPEGTAILVPPATHSDTPIFFGL